MNWEGIMPRQRMQGLAHDDHNGRLHTRPILRRHSTGAAPEKTLRGRFALGHTAVCLVFAAGLTGPATLPVWARNYLRVSGN